jgi:hypothetical protein
MGNELAKERFRDIMNPDAADEELDDGPGELRDKNQDTLT